ncbi:MAG: hypothetical protein GY795_17920, partial [Desulfobacterales bacterium]|nr:hypothetical protein [Desulfobacterales bacterium]
MILKTFQFAVKNIEEFIDIAIKEEMELGEFETKLNQTNLSLFIKKVFRRFNNILKTNIDDTTNFQITVCGIDAIAMAKEIRLIIKESNLEEGLAINEIPLTVFKERILTYIYYGSRIAEDKTFSEVFNSKIIMFDEREGDIVLNKNKNHFVISNSIEYAKDFIKQFNIAEYVLVKET